MDQYDTDGDGEGDVCDTCLDGDCFTDTLPDCTGITDQLVEQVNDLLMIAQV